MIEAGAEPSVARMGMLLVLVKDRGAVTLGADSARRLADLGVTRLAVLQDEEGIALALEGWAFDPVRSAHRVLEVIAPDAEGTRIFQQVAEVAVAAGVTDGQSSSGRTAASPAIDPSPAAQLAGGDPARGMARP